MSDHLEMQASFLAIARAVRYSAGYDDWNASFNSSTLREVYRLAVRHLDDATCRANDIPTLAALDEAEHQAAQAGHRVPQQQNDELPPSWTKTTGEAL